MDNNAQPLYKIPDPNFQGYFIMSFVSHYQGAEELPLSPSTQAAADAGAEKLREMIVRLGFAKEAADSIQFNIRSYTLTITPEEARTGAGHPYADGKPFYEIQITAPGSFASLDTSGSAPTALPADKQAMLVAFEISFNSLRFAEEMIAQKHGIPADPNAGSANMSFSKIDTTTYTRREPEMFFEGLTDYLQLRLAMQIVAARRKEQETPDFKTAHKPKPPGL